MWCVTLTDLWTFNHFYIHGINPTWSWCMTVLMDYWILFDIILLGNFVSMFIRYIEYSFLSFGVLVCFWYQGNAGLIKGACKYLLLLYFLKEFEKYWCLFFFKYLVEFTSEAIWSWTFVCCFFKVNLISLLVIRLLRFSVSSWFSLGRFYALGIYSLLLGGLICWHIII